MRTGSKRGKVRVSAREAGGRGKRERDGGHGEGVGQRYRRCTQGVQFNAEDWQREYA